MMKMEGIITPIVTPFHRDAEQSINYEATEKLINHLIEHGVNGIFILGSNGEFHVIDEDEKIEMTKRVVEIVNKRVPVYVGTGCCSTRATVRLSQKVEAAGADALSVITPYFLKPTNENLYAHYKAVAESVNIPIVLYNIPKATGCPLDPELVDRLADFDNIQGIKDSSGETDRLQAYAEISKRKELQLLVGSDSKISYAYGLGATGAVAGTSNVIVDTLVGLDKALRAGDTLFPYTTLFRSRKSVVVGKECTLLYLNGTVTNELLKGEKVIAIVVENTLMSLKNQIRMSYRGAERECENLTFADGHYGYLSLKKEFELWVSHREEINRTVEVLRENGVNADFLLAGTVYWTAGGDKFYAPVVNASSGYTLVQDKGSSYVSRAAVGK